MRRRRVVFFKLKATPSVSIAPIVAPDGLVIVEGRAGCLKRAGGAGLMPLLCVHAQIKLPVQRFGTGNISQLIVPLDPCSVVFQRKREYVMRHQGEPVLDTKQAATYLNVSCRALGGRPKFVRCERGVIYLRASLEDWVENRSTNDTDPNSHVDDDKGHQGGHQNRRHRPLRSGIPEPRQVRRGARPADGQISSLTLSTRGGALQIGVQMVRGDQGESSHLDCRAIVQK